MYLKALANVITFGIIENVKIYILFKKKKKIIGDCYFLQMSFIVFCQIV